MSQIELKIREKRVHEPEDSTTETVQPEAEREKKRWKKEKKKEQNLRTMRKILTYIEITEVLE